MSGKNHILFEGAWPHHSTDMTHIAILDFTTYILYNIFIMIGVSLGKDGAPVFQRETLVSQISKHLRDRIATFSLAPGERIDVKRLSQELSISPTPLREALHKLVEQGLVIAKPYVGYFIVELSSEDIQELFELRKAIEILALKHTIENLDAALLAKLHLYQKKLEEEQHVRVLTQEVREFDEEFHVKFLIEGLHNKWLMKLGNSIIDLIKLTTRLSLNPVVASAEHRGIIEAIIARNLGKATLLLEAHLDRARDDSIMALRSKETARMKEEAS